MSKGIDYGLGLSNVDRETGIRYGVIPQGELGDAWFDASELDYGEATCGDCGNPAVEYSDEKHEAFERIRGSFPDYACEACKKTFSSDYAFSEEALGADCPDKHNKLCDSCIARDRLHKEIKREEGDGK